MSKESETVNKNPHIAAYVLVRIYRPEGYEDVCDELVAEDALRGAIGFEWELERNPHPTH